MSNNFGPGQIYQTPHVRNHAIQHDVKRAAAYMEKALVAGVTRPERAIAMFMVAHRLLTQYGIKMAVTHAGSGIDPVDANHALAGEAYDIGYGACADGWEETDGDPDQAYSMRKLERLNALFNPPKEEIN